MPDTDNSTAPNSSVAPNAIPPIEIPRREEEHIFLKFVHKYHSACYCFVILFIVIMFGSFLCNSNSNLKVSQAKIISVFEFTQNQTETNIKTFIRDSEKHRNNLHDCVDKQLRIIAATKIGDKDSVTCVVAGLYSRLEADVSELRIQNEIISRTSTDSLTRKYEAMINNQVTEKLLDLHLSKIEHEYTNITIWAAILTVIFLIFSFYSLFKIEQSRGEIEQLTNDGRVISNSIYSQLERQNQSITSRVDSYINNLIGLESDYRDKLTELDLRLQELNNNTASTESTEQPNQEA